jgi:hypothetical protein
VTPFATHRGRDRANSTGNNSSFPFSRNGSVVDDETRPVTSAGEEGEQRNKKQKALAVGKKLLGRKD